ncbi:MAG: Na+/H+ antiporter subunit B [Planctomycetota bacterium]
MNSLIFQTGTKLLLPLLLMFSLVILFQGHNEPGGGFIGGLVAAASFALYSMAFGTPAARSLLRIDLFTLMGIGLLLAIGSGLFGLALGHEFLKGLWTQFEVDGLGVIKVGTPVFFDIGVYLTVIAVALTFVFTLEES